MKLQNSFEIPQRPRDAWTLLLDVEKIAPCLPGAEITEVVDDRTYKGRVNLRLGLVSLSFSGKAELQEIDESTHTARIKAQGKDTKGRGGAKALIDFQIEPTDAGSKVLIGTDLNLSGSIAQYGRGVSIIKDVSTQLIDDFSASLHDMLASSEDADHATIPTPASRHISGFTLLLKVLWKAVTRLFAPTSSPNSDPDRP